MTQSVLAGAIWQVKDNLSFDAAFRYSRVNGRPVNEIRAGMTFSFKPGGESPSKNEGVVDLKTLPARDRVPARNP